MLSSLRLELRSSRWHGLKVMEPIYLYSMFSSEKICAVKGTNSPGKIDMNSLSWSQLYKYESKNVKNNHEISSADYEPKGDGSSSDSSEEKYGVEIYENELPAKKSVSFGPVVHHVEDYLCCTDSLETTDKEPIVANTNRNQFEDKSSSHDECQLSKNGNGSTHITKGMDHSSALQLATHVLGVEQTMLEIDVDRNSSICPGNDVIIEVEDSDVCKNNGDEENEDTKKGDKSMGFQNAQFLSNILSANQAFSFKPPLNFSQPVFHRQKINRPSVNRRVLNSNIIVPESVKKRLFVEMRRLSNMQEVCKRSSMKENEIKMSERKWEESRQGRKLVTSTNHVNLKSQTHGGPGGLVSYEDLLIAQYLDELRNARKGKPADDAYSTKPSPYTQKLPHSDYTFKYRVQRRPASASNISTPGKPKIDAKFIADPTMWDPATPRLEDEGTEKYTPIVTEKMLRMQRPASAPAPVKRNKLNRPTSAASTMSYYSRGRPFSGKTITYFCGKRIKSQYRKQPHTIRVTAFRNGSREPFVRLAAPNIKMLLEYCTDKLSLPFAARRVFLEDGIEVFSEKDIPLDSEVYISTGENYKDPYATTKRNIILTNGAKWTLSGVTLPEEGKKRVSKPRLSKRMKKLADHKCVRIIVYHNGKSIEPVEVVADLSKQEEFLVACTAKLDLRSHAKILYDWEGNEITSLAETPVLDDCLQPGGTCILGPVWVSTGEGFSPSGTRDFLLSIQEVLNGRLKEAKKFRKELRYMQDGETDKIKIAIKILSMTSDEVEEAIIFTDSDIDQLTETLDRIKEKLENLSELVSKEEAEGTHFRMRHIRKMSPDRSYKMVGMPGLKLKIHENGTANVPREFYFNVRKAAQGSSKELIMQRLLDELSGMFVNPLKPKIAPVAKKIFNTFGQEITDVFTLQSDQEIWVSFGEPYMSPFTFCLQTIFDQVKGKDVFGEKQVILREQLQPDLIDEDNPKSAANCEYYEAHIGMPPSYQYEQCQYDGERDHVNNLAAMAELDPHGHYLQYMLKPSTVLYPEIIMNHKLPKNHKELWPSETQIWVISKSGFIYIKPFPQMCLAVSSLRINTQLSGRNTAVSGYVVTLQKKMVGNPHQMWNFNPDATISSKQYPDLLLTYLGKRFGENSDDVSQPEGVKPGVQVYLVVSEPLTKKHDKPLQRFALKQERFDNIGQWKHNDATNPEWNKQALSWPTKADGSLNQDYDWPMEGYIIPCAPKLHKKISHEDGLTGMTPLRLMVLKNGERNTNLVVPVVGPNLTNFMKDLSKKPPLPDGKKSRRKQQQQKHHHQQDDMIPEAETGPIEMDVNLHCRDLTVRELEFSMFLDHCTSLLNLPFAGRRLFDQNGNEHFTLKTLKRDQLVFVSCGEIWTDPNLTKVEQQRRFLLSQLAQDVAKIRQYAALRNPERYVLQVDSSMQPNTQVIVHQQWSKDDEMIDPLKVDGPVSMAAKPPPSVQSENADKTCHDLAHERSEQRLNNLKWPWERLVNVNNSFDSDPEANKYTDREMYEKFKPKQVTKISRDTLQRFVFEDGYIALASNKNLVLSVSEPEGRVVDVRLMKRRPDDIYQQWLMKENGEIRPRHSLQTVLTVSMPNNEPFAEDEQGRPLTFIGCKVMLQTRRTNEFGKAHQRWRYDAETGFIHAFYTDLPDKEITAANKADVCTFSIANTSKIDQPGYVALIPVLTPPDRTAFKQIRVCVSCARAMRGRYKLIRLPENTPFSCAMGNAKGLKLPQVGSFRVLNGKVDLSTHEYKLTLQEWEEKLRKLHEATSARVINKEINVARTVRTIKVQAYKNGEGRLRPGEIICGSSVIGILSQCTTRLGLNQAAVRMFTEDGTTIVEVEDIVDWAVDNYQAMWVHQVERMEQGKTDEDIEQRGEGEGQEGDTEDGQEKAETDSNEAGKARKRREYLLAKYPPPPTEVILRYPIEVWVSSGKPFVPPEVVESKVENRKKKRAFRSAVSLELDIEKHILRSMKGRRLDELSPGEYKGTKNSQKPVVVEGHWEEPTPEEQEKHDTVHKLQEHLAEVKMNQKEKTVPLVLNMNKSLYKQPDTKRIQAYPNGESVERATYIWGDTFQQLLDSATFRLNLWQPARRFFTLEGNEVTKFSDIQKDEVLCVSTGKPFKQSVTSRLDVEVKANWSRAHKQYGPTATDVHVVAPSNPNVNVDPFGPPALALPLTNGDRSANPLKPITDKTTSAKAF